MAHLLLIESWMRSTGEALPPLLRAAGHRFTLATRDPALYPPASDGGAHPVVALADEVAVCDTNDPQSLLAEVTRRHTADPFDGVLTTCDYYLAATTLVAEELGLPGAAPAAVHVATRKDLVRAALTRAGVPNVRFANEGTWEGLRKAADQLGYPLVAKPVDLNSGTLVRLVADEAGLRDVFDAVQAASMNTRDQPLACLVLLEEVLIGAEVSVEAVTVAGRTTVIGVTDKSVVGAPSFVESGHQFPAALAPTVTDAVAALVDQALVAIGWSHGVTHTEVMLTPAGPRIVEINPRQGGNFIFDLVRLVTGTSVLEVMVDLALGHHPLVGTASDPSGNREATSAAVAFVLSPQDGELVGVAGADALASDPDIVRVVLPPSRSVRQLVYRPRDNEDYLGHVLAVDRDGLGARERAVEAVRSLRLRFSDGEVRTPVDPAQP